MRKPPAYCSAPMMAMLRRIAAGKGRDVLGAKPAASASTYASLRSRGWVNGGGQVTDAGRTWLRQNEGE